MLPGSAPPGTASGRIAPRSWKHLDLELTERCNNDCIHCCINLPADDARAQQRELSTAEVKDILDPGRRHRRPVGALHRRRTAAAAGLRRALSLCPAAGTQGAPLYQCPPDHPRVSRSVGRHSPPGENRGQRLRHEAGILRGGGPGFRLLRGVPPRHRTASGASTYPSSSRGRFSLPTEGRWTPLKPGPLPSPPWTGRPLLRDVLRTTGPS